MVGIPKFPLVPNVAPLGFQGQAAVPVRDSPLPEVAVPNRAGGHDFVVAPEFPLVGFIFPFQLDVAEGFADAIVPFCPVVFLGLPADFEFTLFLFVLCIKQPLDKAVIIAGSDAGEVLRFQQERQEEKQQDRKWW